MKCPICENLYPPVYKICPQCKIVLIKELRTLQISNDEQILELELELEPITPYVENGDTTDFEGQR